MTDRLQMAYAEGFCKVAFDNSIDPELLFKSAGLNILETLGKRVKDSLYPLRGITRPIGDGLRSVQKAISPKMPYAGIQDALQATRGKFPSMGSVEDAFARMSANVASRLKPRQVAKLKPRQVAKPSVEKLSLEELKDFNEMGGYDALRQLSDANAAIPGIGAFL